jgi:hypothetical protein
MATTLQLRRGNTAQTIALTANSGELWVNTDTTALYVHDGSTVGGTLLAKQSFVSNVYSYANTLSSQSGWTANSIILANSTGYLSNTNNLQYISSNNALVSSGVMAANAVNGTYVTQNNIPVATYVDMITFTLAIG